VLRWRIITALVFAPIAIGALMLGRWAVLVVTFLLVVRAAQELARALQPLPFPAALGSGALPVLLSIPYGLTGALAGVFLSLPWSLFWLSAKPDYRTLRALLALLLMALWVGAPLAHLGLIWDVSGGRYLLIIAVVGPWISDAGAYFAGYLFGRHPLFPVLSPKKTIEGAAGGLLLTAAAVGSFSHTFLDLSTLVAVLVGAAVSVSSQAGDLFESVLKRILDLKDLGRALPGHGGLLDRIDSLIFTAPAVYYFYTFYLL